jgi:hypothetical protein
MTSRRSILPLACILLLAAAARFYRIDAQSLWSDEGSSVAQALRDIPAIVANAARDIHPPLYYILLHFWVIPFGLGEASVRALSAILGLALVALCYLLGKTVGDRRTGLVAALLAAVNPFQVYYAQEARMYMLMAVLGAVCVCAALKSQFPNPKLRVSGLQPQAASWWIWYAVYAVAAVMGLYTHYFFPIVLVVANAIFFLRVVRMRGRPPPNEEHRPLTNEMPSSPSIAAAASGAANRDSQGTKFAAWLAVQAGVALAFVPWLPTALHQITTWPSGAQTFAGGEAPLVILRALAEGLSAPRADGVWLALFGLLLLIGALPVRALRGAGHDDEVPLMLLYLLAPVAVMFALALFKESFLKFMLVASPPFLILVARGITRASDLLTGLANHGWRVASVKVRSTQYASLLAPVFLLLLTALPSIASVQNYYFDPRFARDDYRGIVAVVDALERAGDAVILDAPGQQEIFSYYYKGSLPVYALPRQRPPDRAATESELEAIASRHSRLYVVFWATDESDPQQVVESWLNAHTFKAEDSWYGNVRLALYGSRSVSNQIAHPLSMPWGEAITLQGYTAVDSASAAGDVLQLTLFWRADRPILTNYKVFVHLLDPRGFVVAQRDADPVGGSRPTSGWQTGEMLTDPYGLFIPFGTPPLSYTIEAGLYDPNSGQRLRNPAGDDHLLLGTVAVRPTVAPHAIPGMQRLDSPWPNGLTLLGYRLDKVGAEGQRAVEFHPGDAVHLVLFWQKSSSAAGDGAYRLQLGPLTRQTTPSDGLYPVSRWSDGEVVRDDQIIPLPIAWQSGIYNLRVDDKAVVDVEIR